VGERDRPPGVGGDLSDALSYVHGRHAVIQLGSGTFDLSRYLPARGVPEQPGDIVVFSWDSVPDDLVVVGVGVRVGFADNELIVEPEDEYADQLAHDLQPDGCWATEFVSVWIDDPPGPGLAPNPSPDAEACDHPAVDELGLCAEHRRRMVTE
jgi:hypothetical protein